MKALVTGGAGFIGSNFVRMSLARGWDIRVLDDMSTGHEQNLHGLDVEVIRGSILDQGALERACKNREAIIHLAALGSVPRSIVDPVASHQANATGTLAVLEQARRSGVGHVVLSSSSSVYGMNPVLPKHERQWVRPMSPYAVSKLAAEQYTLAYQQSYGLRTTAYRFFNVFGPRQRAGHVYAAVIPRFVEALLGNKPLQVFGDGTNSRDFTYVGTVCDVLMRTIEGGITDPEPVNLAFGTNTSLVALIAELQAVTGLEPQVVMLAPRSGDVPHSQADSAKLRQLIPGLEPIGLTQGLRDTVEWFQSSVLGQDDQFLGLMRSE